MLHEKQQAQEAQAITMNTSGYNPALDPCKPEFDPATWRKFVKEVGGVEAAAERMKQAFIEPAARAQAYTHLTMGQIERLPDDERKLVWDEMARRLAESPEIVTFINSVGNGMSAAIESAQKTFSAIVPMLATAREKWDTIGNQLKETSGKVLQAINSMLEGDGIEDYLQIWETLQPYMDEEYDADPDKYNNNGSLGDLIAAAARRARADGKDIPILKAEQGQAEQLEMNLTFPTEETAKEDEPQQAPIEVARSAGAITTLDNHVATIADKLFQYCFTSRNIWQLPGKHDDFMFDIAGKLNELSLNGEPLQPLDEIHTGFLMALLKIATEYCDLREYNSKDNSIIPVYLPPFFRETKVDPRPREWDKEAKAIKKRAPAADDQTQKQLRINRFMEFMRPLDNRVGTIAGDGYYTLARFISWDEKTDTAYISIPYEIKLVELTRLHADRHSAISTIFHADILTENQAAVELANRIAVGLIERGVTRSQADTYKNDTPRKPIRKTKTTTAADGTKTTETVTYQPEPEPVTVTREKTDENGITTTVTRTNPRPRIFRWESRFDTLISDCPQLRRELDEIRSSGSKDKSQRVNKKLKDSFTAAIRIIMQKSDVPQYYAGLEIKTSKFDTFKAPTNSTLKDKIVITHMGKNPNYTG